MDTRSTAEDWLTWERIRDLATCRVLREREGRLRILPGPRTTADHGVLRIGVWGVRREPPPHRTIPRAAVVNTRDAWWAPWRDRLAAQPHPYVLVSNFHDSTITDRAVAELRRSGSAVRAWFGVQVASTSPHVVAMPVGCEGETVARMPRVEPRAKAERDVPLYLNFKRRNAERTALYTRWSWAARDAWAVDGTDRYLAMLARSRFVLSPPGRGWDCYRTYEAIAMGAIPIVLRSAVSPVCEGLPVLVVEHWDDVTRDRLDTAWATVTGSVERMTMTYWRRRIAEAVKEIT